MWQKFRDEDRRHGITMSDVLSPILEPTTLEATISECSLEVKPSDIFTPKLKDRCLSCCYVILIIFLPLLLFVFLLEWRRTMLMESYEPFIANGTFHLAHTSCGPVEGMARDGGFEFLGIPYAIQPGTKISTDEKLKNFTYMWEPGTPAFRLEHCWKGTLKYPESKPQECLHFQPSKNAEKLDVRGSVDCLTLDIYSPFIGYDTPSPVVVVVAIPSLYGGWSDQLHRDMVTPTAKLAKEKGVVFVVPRFRLGPLGFLPRLLLNDTTSVTKNNSNFQETIIQIHKMQIKLEKSYNLGLTDLTAALMWIQTNIEHFGGDASLVTLLGWGGGSDLITVLGASRSPRRHPFLFTQAWITHSSMQWENLGKSYAPGENSTYQPGYELWAHSPCNNNRSSYDPFCLLGLSGQQLFESVPSHWLINDDYTWLKLDNFVYRIPPNTVWSKGTPPNDFPFVIGSSAHGSVDSLCDCQDIKSKALADFEKLRRSRNDTKGSVKSYGNASDVILKIEEVSNLGLTCPLWNLARAADSSFVSGVFFYDVTFKRKVDCGGGEQLQLAGALSDIGAILDRYPKDDAASRQFAEQLQTIFYGFVIDGVLPEKKRARQGFYDFGSKFEAKENFTGCSSS